jgi:hypothetical protein
MKRTPFYLALIVTGWAGLVGAPVLLNWSRYCFNNYDLGIYSQALAKITWTNLNPWLSVRQINVFNDHFDPVVALLSLLAKWADPSLAAIMIELGFVLVTAWAISRKAVDSPTPLPAWHMTTLLLFSTATTAAVTFPVHPATWSILPLAIMLSALADGHRATGFLAAFVLLWFKEEYIHVLAFMGVGLVLSRKRQSGLQLLGLSCAWAVVVFGIRPRLLGPSMEYATSLLSNWVATPAATFRERILDFGVWKGIAELVLPFAPVFLWMRRERIAPNVPALLALIGLFGIRLISGRWSHHYWIPLLVCLLLIPGPSGRRLPSRLSMISVVLLLVIQLPYLGKYVGRSLVRGGLSHCPADPERLREIGEAMDLIREEARQHGPIPVIAGGNLVPRLLDQPEVLHLGTRFTPPTQASWLLVETFQTANLWPLNRDTVEEALQGLRRDKTTDLVKSGKWIRLERSNARSETP